MRTQFWHNIEPKHVSVCRLSSGCCVAASREVCTAGTASVKGFSSWCCDSGMNSGYTKHFFCCANEVFDVPERREECVFSSRVLGRPTGTSRHHTKRSFLCVRGNEREQIQYVHWASKALQDVIRYRSHRVSVIFPQIVFGPPVCQSNIYIPYAPLVVARKCKVPPAIAYRPPAPMRRQGRWHYTLSTQLRLPVWKFQMQNSQVILTSPAGAQAQAAKAGSFRRLRAAVSS